MCDGLGRQFSYSCPNATLFQQRMLICDHWYMVNCSKSEVDYRANLLIGQKDKPFVEDSETDPYSRTPRPDLLSNAETREYNFIYRNGKSQYISNLNLVGVETDGENNGSTAPTNRPSYSLPSHWFTELNKEAVTTQRTQVKTIKLIKTDSSKKSSPEINKVKVKPLKHKILEQKQPSMYFQPPEIESTTELLNLVSSTTIETKSTNDVKESTDEEWKKLRLLFLIPDYQFPLDSAYRPGYDSGQSSFEVKHIPTTS